ncbi:MAG: hypothetical protein LBQ51_04570 [Desulfovibrio sp.]|jgi:hypothetical protein|nr:hypothetical protein [Desulfovibrio sp.]
MRSFDEEKELKQIQNRMECFRQTNQAGIDVSLKTLWGLLLLNGLAASAILTNAANVFYAFAPIFAWGAIAAVFSLGISYVYILLLGETWRSLYPPNDMEENCCTFVFIFWRISLTYKRIEQLRIVPVLFAVCSLVLFIVGVIRFSRVV